MDAFTTHDQNSTNTTWSHRRENSPSIDLVRQTLTASNLRGPSTASGLTSPSSVSQRSRLGTETPVTEQSCEEEPESLDPVNPNDEYIMVTGGLGYIGSHTTLELLISGYNVIVIDNLNNSHDKVLNTITQLASNHFNTTNSKAPKLIFHEMDFRSSAMRGILSSYAVRADSRDESVFMETVVSSRITAVIHFAAYKSVEESISSPLRYYQNNLCGLVGFLGMLDEFNIHNFVFSSSATVYGSKALQGVPLHEEDLVHHPMVHTDSSGESKLLLPGATGVTSPYGRTKQFAESILADIAYADPKWQITALRYFNPVGCHPSGLLGEDPRQKPTNLFPVIGRILTGENDKLSIFGSDWDTPDGTAVRDFIHILDLARGHVVAAANRSKVAESFRAYNLGTGTGASVKEVVDAVGKIVGYEIPVTRSPRRAGDVGYCVAATSRVESELGWKAVFSLTDGARDMWNFLRKTKVEATCLQEAKVQLPALPTMVTSLH